MRNAASVWGLMLVLLVAGTAWTTQQTSASRAALTGRVISVGASGQGASGQIVTIEATDGSTGRDAITVGEPVEVLVASEALAAGELDTPSGNPTQGGTATSEPKRRLMGVWLLAIFGVVVGMRARRPRLI